MQVSVTLMDSNHPTRKCINAAHSHCLSPVAVSCLVLAEVCLTTFSSILCFGTKQKFFETSKILPICSVVQTSLLLLGSNLR